MVSVNFFLCPGSVILRWAALCRSFFSKLGRAQLYKRGIYVAVY